MKMMIRIWRLTGLLLVVAGLGTGCASWPAARSSEPNVPAEPVQRVLENTVTKADVVRAAEYVLTRMHFPIEKLDAEQGIVRTRPLRGAQFFEFWRSDNVGAYDYAEASLQSIRRSVVLRVKPEDGGRKTEDGSDARLCVECIVSVQRLRLPGNEVTGVSAAYGIYARNTPTLQRMEMSQQQRRDMAWIDLGQDQALAAGILDRIEKRLEHTD